MCTAIILRRPKHSWPLLLAANRDEMIDRKWDIPARHWPDRPYITAGRDRFADGSWLGINDSGVTSMVLNRTNSLGPKLDKRSRGELVLESLDFSNAPEAAKALEDINPDAYRSFNLIVADAELAFWIRHDGYNKPTVNLIPDGLSMITSNDLNDKLCPRINYHLSRFSSAPPPDLSSGDIFSWEVLLADQSQKSRPSLQEAAICLSPENGFGTVSSSIIGIPNTNSNSPPTFLFANGAPGTINFAQI